MNSNLDLIVDRIYERFSEYNSEVLELMADTIAKFKGLTPTQAHQLAIQLKNGQNVNAIIRKLAKLSNLTKEEVRKILEDEAKKNIELAQPFYEYRGITTSYQANKRVQDLVDGVAKATNLTFENIANTTAFKLLDRNGMPMLLDIKQTYIEMIDRSVFAINTGQDTFYNQMRKTINQLADSGVKKVEYKSGYARRLDSSVRMNIKQASKQVNLEMQKIIGEEIGADGIEVSVHERPAPDHAEIQGRQFTNEEFDNLQNDKDARDYKGKLFTADFHGHDRRSIAELNCYHYVFPIVLGIQEPLYTDRQLEKILKRNEEGFMFEDKHYTMYEGQELQRKIETKIRDLKDGQVMYRKINDEKETQKAQKKINVLTSKYNKLCKISGLPSKRKRMTVSGYRKVKVK